MSDSNKKELTDSDLNEANICSFSYIMILVFLICLTFTNIIASEIILLCMLGMLNARNSCINALVRL